MGLSLKTYAAQNISLFVGKVNNFKSALCMQCLKCLLILHAQYNSLYWKQSKFLLVLQHEVLITLHNEWTSGFSRAVLGNFKINVFKISFRNTIRVSNSLELDQDRLLLVLIWFQTICKGYQQTHAGYFSCFVVVCIFFQNQLFIKFFKEHYQSVKQFGTRSELTFCWS